MMVGCSRHIRPFRQGPTHAFALGSGAGSFRDGGPAGEAGLPDQSERWPVDTARVRSSRGSRGVRPTANQVRWHEGGCHARHCRLQYSAGLA